MTPDQLATQEFIKAQIKELMAGIQSLPILQKPPVEEDIWYTIEQVMERTGFSRGTVEKWIKQGKKDPYGKTVKLQYDEFAPGTFRINRKDLLAFGRVGQVAIAETKLRIAN